MWRILCNVLYVAMALAVASCKPALTCDGTHSCPSVTMEDKLKNLDNGFSGMARIDANNFLVVHDYKNFSGELRGRRLGIVNVSHNILATKFHYRDIVNLHHDRQIEGWPRVTPGDSGGVANDLESACALSGHANQFLVAESGSWNHDGGRIFRVTLDSGLKTYTVALNPEILPGLFATGINPDGVRHTDESSDENYEGIACWQQSDGNYLVLLGERGATGPDPSGNDEREFRRTEGALKWARFDPATNEFVWQAPIEVKVAPGLHKEGVRGCWRDISGLHIDASRRIWATATYDVALDDETGEDPCNNDNSRPADGRPYAVVYLLGAICEYKGDRVLSNGACAESAIYPRPVVLNSFTVNRRIDGYKIEAIAAPQGNGMSALTIASEDETDIPNEKGGSWWNRP